MTIQQNAHQGASFLDMQAAIGITKHIGGFAATDEILSLCHTDTAHNLLNIGCGIGVGPAYIAKKYACHVVGVDISEKMLDWAQRRVCDEGVAGRVDLHAADVLALPFQAGQFDAVICESVLIFVDDKARAIRECVRVTRPGGYVGLNEGFWFKEPSPAMLERVKVAIGPSVPTLEAWQSIWEASGLHNRIMRPYHVDTQAEVKGRIAWIGWRWLMKAWVRGLRLYLMNPQIRQSIKDQLDVPHEVFQDVGYGLFVGQK